MTPPTDDVVWRPPERLRTESRMAAFSDRIATSSGLPMSSYHDLWAWSAEDVGRFWTELTDFLNVPMSGPPGPALTGGRMPDVEWFVGRRVNFAEQLLSYASARDEEVAIEARTEGGSLQTTTWGELRAASRSMAGWLRRHGVEPGDRVVGYLPNIAETVVSMIAAASIGAVWAVVPPEYELEPAVARLGQLDPVVLVTATGYRYGGRTADRRPIAEKLRASLPTVREVIEVPYPYPSTALPGTTAPWDEVVSAGESAETLQVPFDHPLWILFSSGTTGIPKAIVHGHGGTLLEQLKANLLHFDLRRDDRYLFYSTTGWMVWNVLISGLLSGATVVLYDGSPTYPEPDTLWHVTAESRATVLGTGAAYLVDSARRGAPPATPNLRMIVSTGSPLLGSAYDWAAEHLPRVWLASASGGTDVCTSFVGPTPLLPVRRGRMQCRWLGVAADTWDPGGMPVRGVDGELVITRPMPSMPVGFWGDTDGSRYRDTYFATFPGAWRQGDWASLDTDGSVTISGRSDSTINRQGVRMGSAEFYAVLDDMDSVDDSLVVGVELPDDRYELIALVVPSTEAATAAPPTWPDGVRRALRSRLSPRHVPDLVVPVSTVPRGRTGKRLEVPVKRIAQGTTVAEVADPGATDLEVLREVAEAISRARH